MKYGNFRDKYKGQKFDYDGAFGYQCVDLVKLWARDGWGLKPHSVGEPGGYAKNVISIPTSMLRSDAVYRIVYRCPIVPPQGAIIVFDAARKNPAGHIAIVDRSDNYKVTVLEQNGGNASGDGQGANAIRLKTYGYGPNSSGVGAVLGWLIPRKGPVDGSSGGRIPDGRK